MIWLIKLDLIKVKSLSVVYSCYTENWFRTECRCHFLVWNSSKLVLRLVLVRVFVLNHQFMVSQGSFPIWCFNWSNNNSFLYFLNSSFHCVHPLHCVHPRVCTYWIFAPMMMCFKLGITNLYIFPPFSVSNGCLYLIWQRKIAY